MSTRLSKVAVTNEDVETSWKTISWFPRRAKLPPRLYLKLWTLTTKLKVETCSVLVKKRNPCWFALTLTCCIWNWTWLRVSDIPLACKGIIYTLEAKGKKYPHMWRRDRILWSHSTGLLTKLRYFDLTIRSFRYYYRWSLPKVMRSSLRETSLNLVSIASIRLPRASLGHGNINLIPGESSYHNLVYFLQAVKTCRECFSISGLKRIWDQNIPFRWESHLTIIFRIWFNY